MEKENHSFEKAFLQLESILESINEGKLELDEALKLYEEADGLILSCNRQLQAAEKKVEMLIKNRNKELTLDDNGSPRTEAFSLEEKLESPD